jgi:hypothetical protein
MSLLGRAGPGDPDAVKDAPRYLRFVAALVLGAGVAVVAACDDKEEQPPIDASVTPADAEIPDSYGLVDGPLHPPDLPRRTAA